jgi:hypothetical protein
MSAFVWLFSMFNYLLHMIGRSKMNESLPVPDMTLYGMLLDVSVSPRQPTNIYR